MSVVHERPNYLLLDLHLLLHASRLLREALVASKWRAIDAAPVPNMYGEPFDEWSLN